MSARRSRDVNRVIVRFPCQHKTGMIPTASGDRKVSISFTPWASWAHRNSLDDKDRSGVYLIGRFEQPPPAGPADPLEKNIVYIGESAEGRFQSRWRAFARSAFGVGGKHRGGRRYREKFGGDSSVLYVSALSCEGLMKALLGIDTCSLLDIDADHAKLGMKEEALPEINSPLAKYMERRLILLYSLAHGHMPPCNGD